MTATSQHPAPDNPVTWDATRVAEVRPRPVKPSGELPALEPSRAQRAFRALNRFVIAVGIGGTLAWQAYGDTARKTLATAYPAQLGWIVPPAPPPAPAPKVAAPTPPAPSVDQQKLNAMAADLAAVRQSVEQLAAQVNANHQQTSGDIVKLQAAEQEILSKIPAPPPAPAPARRPAPPPPAPPVR